MAGEQTRNCADCKYLKAYTSWWCINSQAVEHHGTSLPGRQNCKFWEQGTEEDWYSAQPKLMSGKDCLIGFVIAMILIGCFAAYEAYTKPEPWVKVRYEEDGK